MRKTILVAGAALAALWSGGAGAPVSANAKGASSPEVRVQLVQGREESLTKALARLKDPDPEARQRAAEYLGQKGDMTVVKPLASSLADPNPEVRAQTERSMWKIWLRSGDPEIDKILYVGIEFMATGRLQNAIDAFTQVIARAPQFAEGYNKRATALYMASKYRESIADCDATLRLNPFHFGALFGKGLNYIQLRDFPKALEAFRATLKILPYSASAQALVRALEKKIKAEEKET